MDNKEFALEFWDSKPFIEASNILVAADEPLRALKLLENLPAAYRDFPPPEVTAHKRKIMAQLATPNFYVYNPDHTADPKEYVAKADSVLRWRLIKQDVESYNAKGIHPHIIDVGPGEYWLPICLSYIGLNFTYNDVGLSPECKVRSLNRFIRHVQPKTPTDRPVILVACEIIEHLHHEEDILAECMRLNAEPDIVHVSTPKYTFDTRKERLDWERFGTLGHLRTYTLTELFQVVVKMFPGYEYGLSDSKILHVRASKPIEKQNQP